MFINILPTKCLHRAMPDFLRNFDQPLGMLDLLSGGKAYSQTTMMQATSTIANTSTTVANIFSVCILFYVCIYVCLSVCRILSDYMSAYFCLLICLPICLYFYQSVSLPAQVWEGSWQAEYIEAITQTHPKNRKPSAQHVNAVQFIQAPISLFAFNVVKLLLLMCWMCFYVLHF